MDIFCIKKSFSSDIILLEVFYTKDASFWVLAELL